MLNRSLLRSLSLYLSWSFPLLFGPWLSFAHAVDETASKETPQTIRSSGDAKTEPAAKPREAAERSEKTQTPAVSQHKTSQSATVRYLPQKDGVWSVAETDNFRIFFKGDIKPIDKMAQVLEDSRQSAYVRWFGKAEDNWSPKCYLYLDDSGKEFKKAPKNARGYTSAFQKGWNYHRYITVHADDPDLVDTVLPHEITHAVMIGHFVDQLPTWADEGMAGIAQRAADFEDFRKLLNRYERKGKLFALQTLMELEAYPDDDVDLFYAQSALLVEFLLKEKEPKVFVSLLREAKKNGWAPALKQLYGFANFDEFEKGWKKYVFTKADKPGDD